MYALVTGASAGIGKEIAKILSDRGYDLILTARSEDKLLQLQDEILKRYPGRKVLVIPADLSVREECRRLYRECTEKAGRENIDFVVNNAGMGVYGYFLETDLKRTRRSAQCGFLCRFHGGPHLFQLLCLQKLCCPPD